MGKPTIVVTGANGQLASELKVLSGFYTGYEFVFLTRQELPLEQPGIVQERFAALHPQYCINCAAYTAVDRAETEKEMAFRINGEGPGLLSQLSARYNTRFIHISTDYVFNGTAAAPYKEDHPVDPVNSYGASKLQGEALTMQHNPDPIIVRTSWVYSSFGNNFVKTMMRLMKEKESIQVVNDQHGSPTFAADLAAVLLNIIQSGKWQPGIYHYSNEGIITWYEFAVAIKRLTGSNCIVRPVPTSSYPTPAKRPGYSVFDKDKIKQTYQVDIPWWNESLEKCIRMIT